MKKKKADFKELLEREGPIIFDGAMGTNLQKENPPQDMPLEKLNLDRPWIVRDIHLSYIRAGADVIETNTFGANKVKLKRYSLGKEVRAINREGVRIAKEVSSSSNCLIGASIGPLGVLIKPWGDFDTGEAFSAFKEQIEVVSSEGADIIVIETMMDINEAKIAISAAKEVADLPIICQFSFTETGKTLMGAGPDTIVTTLDNLGLQAIGANCSVGPKELFPVAKRMCALSHLPLIFQPNAGRPRLIDKKTVYPVSAEDFSLWMERFIRIGVKIVGGCCGTTPSYIKRMVEQVLEQR